MSQEQEFYLTKEGLAKVKKEFESLKEAREAKTHGDMPRVAQSEDVDLEYLSFKEDMELLDRRLIELDTILKNYKIIKPPKKDLDVISLGADVLLRDGSGNKVNFKIVGTMEADPFEGKISNESPVGKALLGRKAGESVSINNPSGPAYRVLKVQYGES